MNVSIQLFPLLPVGVIAVLVAGLVLSLGYGSALLRRKAVPRRWIVGLGGLRLAAVALFALCLLRPVATYPTQATLAPEALVLIDISQSMGQPSAKGETTRLDEVRSRLAASTALDSAARSHRLRWYAFERRAYPLRSRAEIDGLSPRGAATDLAASLASAAQQARLENAALGRDARPSRVLVVSDGLDHGRDDPIRVALDLGLVVDVLAPPSGGAGDGAALIADLQAAPRVLAGAETALQATVRATADINGLALVVEEDGREIVRRDLRPLSAGSEARVVVTHRPDGAGLRRYVVRLARGDSPVGQPRAVNVQVTDGRHDVLMLEDSWRWDFRHLKRVLEDDPGFSVTAFVSRGAGVYVQFGEPDRNVQLGGFPRSRAELDGFDALILGNVSPQAWPRGLARTLRDAVVDGGKSLIVIAGPKLAEWAEVAELRELLPVDVSVETGAPIAGPIELRPTPEGRASAWFGPAGAPSADASLAPRIAGPALPPVESVYPALRKRPAATVLVETAAHANAYGPVIVIAEHAFGRGRVLFLATDTLWRWQTGGPRTEAGVTLYASFWQQALRGLAPPETTADGRLWLRPERTLYRAGEDVRLQAEWSAVRPDAAQTVGGISVAATVVLPDGRRLPLDLAPEARHPQRRAARFDASLPGRYRIEATARTESRTVGEAATTIEVAPRPAESDLAPVAREFLGRLASATGGREIDPIQPDGWLPSITSKSETVTERRSLDLWQSYALVLALCAVLAADWAIRLFRGYV